MVQLKKKQKNYYRVIDYYGMQFVYFLKALIN